MKNLEIRHYKEDIYEIPSHKQSNSFPLFESGNLTSALYALKKDSFLLVTPEDGPSEIIYFVVKGSILVSNTSEEFSLNENESFKTTNFDENLKITAKSDISTILVSAIGLNDYGLDTLKTSNKLVEELEQKDKYTVGHSKRVCSYAVDIALVLSDPKIDVHDLVRASMLHDIGKTKIPDEILNKPGRYTSEEFEVMKNHPQYSYEMVKDSLPKNIAEMILEHHERYNGTGYPKGLSKNEINPSALVLMVADVFDALTSSRVYRKAFSVNEAMKIIEEEMNRGLYDPKVVEALKYCLKTKVIHLES